MPASTDLRPNRVSLLIVCTLIVISGCTRDKYRLAADRQAYDVIAERNCDPRWHTTDCSIELDPRSRYFDPYDPDHSPMPQDDPDSHEYMHRVNGMKGWKHWHDNGERFELENPAWRDALAEYTETTEDGAVRLTIDSAVQLAYVHSPTHQSQLETLYLSALDVTAERFRLESQFLGGNFTSFQHDGALRPETSALTVTDSLSMSRRFATAGTMLVSIANSFTWEFTQGDFNFASSIISGSLVQPLLRGAGRDIALEDLTFVERALLANLRSYSQFRQGFYTQIAVGELGVVGPQRGGRGTNLPIFRGQGGLGGYVGLLQQLQQIRNTEDNLSLQLRTLAQLEAHLDAGVIDLVQVDQFRQSIENERSNLLQSRNNLEFSLDSYKTDTLGLPPDLLIDLNDSLIRQFQLVTRSATAVQDSISELQDRVGELPEDIDIDLITQVLIDVFKLVDPVRQQLDDVQADLALMEETVPARERTMTELERKLFQRDREQLRAGFADLELEFEEAKATLKTLREGLSEETKDATVRGNVVWLGDLYRIVQGSILVQARARLEAVTVERINLDSTEAFQIALQNRLDFKNGRAALVDDWRQIAVTADALQSNLTVALSGDLRTSGDNAASFDGRNSTGRASVTFDAPLTRLLERNSYRQSLIFYQRGRRDFIQSRDSLHLGLRSLLRTLEQLRTNLEIQRRAVAIAIRRVDLTRAGFYAPVPPPRPGQPAAQFGRTAARDTLDALSALRNTQNNFLAVWLNYYAAQMRLSRELGIMVIDQDGQWLDYPLPSSDNDGSFEGVDPNVEELPAPPVIPIEWIELIDYLPEGNTPPPVAVDQLDVSVARASAESAN